MELIRFVDDLRHRLLIAAETGGDEARDLAERLMAPLEAAVRLTLLEALSAAADEITRELAPGSVDLRLRGLDPEFVVTASPTEQPAPAYTDAGTPAEPTAPPVSIVAAAGDGAEGAMARMTLRLPEPLKQRVEEAAGRSGVSVNAWLVAATEQALGSREPDRRTAASRTPTGGDRITGWAR